MLKFLQNSGLPETFVMKKISVLFLLLSVSFVQITFAQERIDEAVVARIKAEGFQNSKAMETLQYLVDVFGPRLTASPNIRASQKWMVEKMTTYGLANARFEPWGTFGRGWSVESYSIEMLAPTYDRMTAVPLAWSPSTGGEISGEPLRKP